MQEYLPIHNMSEWKCLLEVSKITLEMLSKTSLHLITTYCDH